jgi:predicted nucleic acid-binding protein
LVVFDTNVLIDALGGNRKAAHEIELYKQNALAAITIFNKYELSRGNDRLPSETIMHLIGIFKIYDFGEKEADESSKVYADLKSRGQMIDELDKHFGRVKGLNIKLI